MLNDFDKEKREQIKAELEMYRSGPKKRISAGLEDISFDDLAAALRGVTMQEKIERTREYNVTKLEKKMDINGLTDETRDSIREAIAAAPTVSAYVRTRSMGGDEDFPERLTKCFRLVYEEYAHNGYKNDDLYDTITMDIVNRAGIKKPKEISAVAALQAYLFERCEIFKTRPDEKEMIKKWGEW